MPGTAPCPANTRRSSGSGIVPPRRCGARALRLGAACHGGLNLCHDRTYGDDELIGELTDGVNLLMRLRDGVVQVHLVAAEVKAIACRNAAAARTSDNDHAQRQG